MTRRTLLTTAAMAAVGRALAADQTGIRKFLEDAVAKLQIPGAVVTVQQHGKPVIEEAAGYAVIETRRPMRLDDMFMIASSSKPVSATTILTLVDAGKLKLDDPVAKYLPAFKGSSTLRQLLCHTSGIFGNNAPQPQFQWIRKFDITLAEAVDHIIREPLAYPPGSAYVYGGADFCVAGRIAEIVSGMEFDACMKRVLWEPLGMTETVFRSPKDLTARIPQMYRKTAAGFEPAPGLAGPPGHRGPIADGFILVSGGLCSTAHDLVRFLEMQRNGGEFNGKRILSREMIAEMHRKQTGSLSAHYGLGWQISDDGKVFSHNGAYGTAIWVDVARDSVGVILTQQPLAEAQPFLRELRDRIDREVQKS